MQPYRVPNLKYWVLFYDVHTKQVLLKQLICTF